MKERTEEKEKYENCEKEKRECSRGKDSTWSGKTLWGKLRQREDKTHVKHPQATYCVQLHLFTSPEFTFSLSILLLALSQLRYPTDALSAPSPFWDPYSLLLPSHTRSIHLSAWPTPVLWLSELIFRLDCNLKICPRGHSIIPALF